MAVQHCPPYFETCLGEDDELLGPRHWAVSTHGKPAAQAAGGRAGNTNNPPDSKNLVIPTLIPEEEFNRGLAKWLPKAHDPQAERRVLRDSIFPQIEDLLLLFGKGEWSLRPRTFAILHMLGCPGELEGFIAENRSDSFLPYTESNLPDVIKGSTMRSKFFRLQQMVLCNQEDISDLEEGGKHLHLSGPGDNYFRRVNMLGMGRFGVVDRVFSRQTLQQYARKVIHRGASALSDSQMCRQFEGEVQALKRLTHAHIVKLVGSYTDEQHLGLIMTPIADMDLHEYLRSPHSSTNGPVAKSLQKRSLRAYFGCLATGLAYLHKQDVRHNDIKPKNILVKDSSVYFSDFGTSRSWGTEEGSSTVGEHEGFTQRYSAPEMHEAKGVRNRASDMWSLGCVFLEMATVLLGRELHELDAFLGQNGTFRVDAFWTNLEALEPWINELRGKGSCSNRQDAEVLVWTQKLLQSKPDNRPSAAQLRGLIMQDKSEEYYICHLCSSPYGIEQLGKSTTSFDVERVPATSNYDGLKSSVNVMSHVPTLMIQVPPRVTASALGIVERDAKPTPSRVFLNEDSNSSGEDEGDSEYPASEAGSTSTAETPLTPCTPVSSHDGPESESKSGVVMETEPESLISQPLQEAGPQEPEPVPEQEREQETDADLILELEPEPELKPSPEQDPEQVPILDSKPEDEREPDPIPQPESNPEPERESEPEPESEHEQDARFIKLPKDRRPKPTDLEHEGDDILEPDEFEFIKPAPVKPPPFLCQASIPTATTVPSYILAGMNRFSQAELDAQSANIYSKSLFVYGRLMFPSVLSAIAAQSIEGVYSRKWKRRLLPSSEDWSKANISIRRASETMTPARLEGYDRWRPSGYKCAAIKDSRLTNKILRRRDRSSRFDDLQPLSPTGHVDGFLILGLREEALRYCDLLFGSDNYTMRTMRPQDNVDGDYDSESASSSSSSTSPKPNPRLLSRQQVTVQVETISGDLTTIKADTYIWTQGTAHLSTPWSEETFLSGSTFQTLLETHQPTWASQEQSLASIMKTSFTQQGDFLCSPILSNDKSKLASLLRHRKFDPNTPCRIYGTPLQAAVSAGRAEMVQLLLDHGATINRSKPSGRYGTPLIAATCTSRKAITKLLLRNGADVFATDRIHVNALYQAVAHSDYAVTEMLLEHAAWLGSDWVETRDMAVEVGDEEIVLLLDRYDVRRIHRGHRAERDGGYYRGGRRIGGGGSGRDGRHYDDHDEDEEEDEENGTWDGVRYKKVMRAVVRKAIAVQKVSGGWKGRKGVAVTVAALDAGAPLKLIGLLRKAVMPLKAIMDLLRKGDEREERERVLRGGGGGLRIGGSRGDGEVYKGGFVMGRDGREEEFKLFSGVSYGSGYVDVADVDKEEILERPSVNVQKRKGVDVIDLNKDLEESKGASSPSSSVRPRRVRFALEGEV